MYIPSAFKEHELSVLHQQIDGSRLGILVTHGAQGMLANHVPLLLNREQGPNGTLYGHLAKANPQWQELASGVEALLIFPGPDAYVSPSFYPSKAEHGQVVPTWNFLAIHAYGTPQVFHDAERLLDVVRALTHKHEADRAKPWAVEDAPAAYIDKMLTAIVGFEVPIARLEGKRKLNQNRNAADIAGVRDGLAASAAFNENELARLMRQGEMDD